MQDSNFEESRPFDNGTAPASEYEDTPIKCMDCSDEFIWTTGEQQFFHDKKLLNPPKRCRKCKKAKTVRLEAIELSKVTGKRPSFEVSAQCAMCTAVTTVPFYPSQNRPVYCRSCFTKISVQKSNGLKSEIHRS
jgi:CxxC-x17-CxxC domain-containing protein